MSAISPGGRRNLLTSFVARARRDLQFSRIFCVDFIIALLYASATIYYLVVSTFPSQLDAALLALAGSYFVVHMAKIWLIVDLERRGGDAREFVGSDRLVTSGVYAVSRNPVYVLSLAQSFLWSLIIVGLGSRTQSVMPPIVAAALLYAHYWGMDRLIIPNEEAALRARHPQVFADYCKRVRRWFGPVG